MEGMENRKSRWALVGWVTFAVVAILAVSAAFYFDWGFRAWMKESQGKGWKKTEEYQRVSAVSKYGDWPQLMLASAVALLIAWRVRRRDWVKVIAAAMIASTLAGILANMSRLTTGRPRPREVPKVADGWYGVYHDGKILVGNSKFNAFPSGHTATAVGFAAAVLFAKPLAGLLVLAGALAVAWSRLALGAHHLSDVTVSIFLAGAVGWVVWRWVDRHGEATWDAAVAWTTSQWKKRRGIA